MTDLPFGRKQLVRRIFQITCKRITAKYIGETPYALAILFNRNENIRAEIMINFDPDAT